MHTVSPNGMIFVKAEVRKGLLGKMLTELLDTRVMVKQSMKGVRGHKVENPYLNFLMAIFNCLTRHILDVNAHPRGPTTQSKIHRQCDLWLHKRDLLWPDACCRDCRCHCPKRPRNTGEGESLALTLHKVCSLTLMSVLLGC